MLEVAEADLGIAGDEFRANNLELEGVGVRLGFEGAELRIGACQLDVLQLGHWLSNEHDFSWHLPQHQAVDCAVPGGHCQGP